MPASHNGWEDVTFVELLNMTSGIGGGTNKADAGMLVDYLDKTYDDYFSFPDHTGAIMYFPYMAGWIGNRILLLPGQRIGRHLSYNWQ